MANNTNEQKYFLDLEGLRTLWAKINSNFANKEFVDNELDTIKTDVSTLTGEFDVFKGQTNNDITAVNETIATFIPHNVENYTNALEVAVGLTPGTVINIKNNETIDGKTYIAGLYMVMNPNNDPNNPNNIIEKVSTSAGSGIGGNIEDLAESLTDLYRVAVTAATIVDEANNPLTPSVTKAENTLVFTIDNEFKVNSDSVNALTHRAISAMYGDLIDKINKLPKFDIKVIEGNDLPTTDISTTTIYLLKNSSTDNLYTEYIYVKEGTDYKWEKLGEQSINVDNFVKPEQLEAAIKSEIEAIKPTLLNALKNDIFAETETRYATKGELGDKVSTNDLTTTLSNYYTKSEADTAFLNVEKADDLYASIGSIDGFMKEDDIIASIQTGNIGNYIRITDDQINSLVAGIE